jgi:hypothetical protein
MQRKELMAISKALGLKKIKDMDDNDLIEYILSRKKSPSPIKPRSRSSSRDASPPKRSAVSKYRAADLLGKKVAELKELAKMEGFKKWKDKTLSKMLKKDLVDYLLFVGGGGVIPATPSPTKPSVGVKTRSELLLYKVPELKAIALSYGLKKYKDKTPTQLRKNDFIDFIISVQKQPSPTPSRKRSLTKARSPSPKALIKPSIKDSIKPSPKYKSKVVTTPDESEEEVVVKKTLPKVVSRSRSPSKSRSIRERSRSPSKSRSIRERSRSPSIAPILSNAPSIMVDPSVSPPSKMVKSTIKPDLPVYTGKQADHDLEILAHEKGYEVVQVKKDGNCLFRSVSKSLSLNVNIKYTHKELRQMTVDYLRMNEDFLKPYLEYITDGDSTPKEYKENAKRYIDNMAKLKTWGDFICLRVLSEILQVKFNLLILNTRSFQMIANNDEFSTLIPLGFIDDYHFTALIPLELVAPSMKPSVAPSMKPSVAPSMKPSVAPSMKPSVAPSMKPSVAPSVVPQPTPSIKPSVVPQPTPSIAPQIPPPVFGKVKPLSSVNELLEIMDKIKPYVYDDISQLQKAENQIKVSLGM